MVIVVLRVKMISFPLDLSHLDRYTQIDPRPEVGVGDYLVRLARYLSIDHSLSILYLCLSKRWFLLEVRAEHRRQKEP
jgi:hypothetical protein